MGKGGGVGAVLGGAAGSAFGPMGTMVGAGLGASIGGGMDANKQAARAAQQAAMAQQAEARRQFNEIKKITEAPTIAAMAQMDKSIAMQEKNISRQEQMISQIDPTIIEASQQALRLLRGETSSTLAPLQKQRDMQRQKLLNSLREQLGPGAETSTAGIQALTRFDSESGNLFASAQQQALGNMGNISSQFSSQRPDMFREIGGFGNLAQGRAQLAYSQANALQGGFNNMYQSAGGQFAGDMVRAQGNQAMYSQLGSIAGMGLGSMMSGAGGGGSSKMTSSGTPGMTPATPGSGQMFNYNLPGYK